MADHEHAHKPSLVELEPSPVEETPSGTQGDSYFPSSKDDSEHPAQPYRSHTLGLSQHSPIWYLSRIQKYSSYAFTAFGLAHITNTAIIPLVTQSVAESERYVLLTRPYYQGLPAEPLLVIIPLWAHLISGVALRIVRRNLNAKRYGETSGNEGKKSFFSSDFWPNVSGISKLGYPFIWLLAGHIFINRGIPNQFTGGQSNVNLSYVSHAFAKHPAISYAGFSALIGAGVFHITWGWAKWLGLTPDQVTGVTGEERQVWKTRRWYVINGLALAVAGLWMAGGFGVVGKGGQAPGYVGRMYDEMYKKIPVVGRWM